MATVNEKLIAAGGGIVPFATLGGGGGGTQDNFVAVPEPGFYGDGSDGDVVYPAGPTNVLRDIYARTITVEAGAVVTPLGPLNLGCILFATVEIRVKTNGRIDASGVNAPSSLGGAGGPDGTTGGSGVINANGGNSTLPPSGNYYGGKGGDGAPSTPIVTLGGTSVGLQVPAPRETVQAISSFNAPPIASIISAGAGGGAGGGVPGIAGGGGGGGGGRIMLVAPRIVVEGGGRVTAVGGNGAPFQGGGSGPGGGGGGGVIWIIGAAYFPLPGSTVSVAGGLRGGAGAQNGSDGFLIRLR